MTQLTAICTPDDNGWTVEVPEIDGLHTQLPQFGQLAAKVRDAASLITHQPVADFEVKIVVRQE
ncbi:hypothetical protein ABIE18_000142 [Arthrobacter sp. 2762]